MHAMVLCCSFYCFNTSELVEYHFNDTWLSQNLYQLPPKALSFQLGGERELESFWKMTIEYLKWCMYVYVYAHSTLLFSGSDMLCRYTTLIIHALIQVS